MTYVLRVSASPTRTNSFWSQTLGRDPVSLFCWDPPRSIESTKSFISSSSLVRRLLCSLFSSSAKKSHPDFLVNSQSHVTVALKWVYFCLLPALSSYSALRLWFSAALPLFVCLPLSHIPIGTHCPIPPTQKHSSQRIQTPPPLSEDTIGVKYWLVNLLTKPFKTSHFSCTTFMRIYTQNGFLYQKRTNL